MKNNQQKSTRGGARDGAGRKPGSPNRATAEVRDLALDYGPAAVKELGRLAAEADSEQARKSACNALIDRAYGKALPGRLIRLDIPDTSTVEGVNKAIGTVIQAAASGQVTSSEAGDFCGLLEAQRRALELSDIELRLARLEAAEAARSGK